MRYISILIVGLVIFTSCGQGAKRDAQEALMREKNNQLEMEKAALEQELENAKQNALDEIKFKEDSITEAMTVAEEEEGWATYTGEHDFSLQWIGWDDMGTCTFELETEGVFYVKGEQRKGDDYVTIDGTLTMQGNEHLLFNGEIITMVSYNNGGEPCVKKGEYNFKATGKRKYWRLQEMDNCEGGNLVDYVDIFFKQ